MSDATTPNFARTIQGPMLLGTFFNLILYGIFLAQTFVYFQTYKRDRMWIKIVVALLIVVETSNSVLPISYSYDRLVNNFGNMPAAGVSTWLNTMNPMTIGIIATMVQLFYAWRVKVLTGRRWWMIAVIVPSIISCTGATVLSIVNLVDQSSITAVARYRPIVIVWLASSALTDTIISVILVSYLRHRRTGFSSTDDTVNKIIRLTVQTGLLTSLFAILDLTLYLSLQTAHHVMINLPLAKLYTNSLMSSLNSRQGWQYDSSNGSIIGSSQLKSASKRNTVFIDIEAESHEMSGRADVKHHTQSLGDQAERSDSLKMPNGL
ncbi:hypothetical protein HETIRDRAFT_446619 [Heterobasidion irregulare TC 32-1]|uniref:DUF6534 domain-containing protein n=1 Tax=Heterobasidion irregulare (strain TC 32-1) TaxID=747525 RepID=W4JVN7_HETIT|nr:uncharacterized protein HETIRDRAFT_446619 [Heterobasidion irregulare TC 32-1]ETW76926.1 hypothetical protein HETIRDRAFT_446619 [Heterobasidion irregulare TC 32-1]